MANTASIVKNIVLAAKRKKHRQLKKSLSLLAFLVDLLLLEDYSEARQDFWSKQGEIKR